MSDATPDSAVETVLAAWFVENLTYEHFRDWSDEEWAAQLAPLIAARVAEEVEAIARKWQWGAWADVLKPPPPGGIAALTHGQQVTDWLLTQAAAPGGA